MQHSFIALIMLIAIKVHAINLFIEMQGKVVNNTPYTIDLFAQVTNPSSDCYGEACIWSAWPKVKIAPGETVNTPLWIGRINHSELIVSVLRSNDTAFENTPQYTTSQYQHATPYLGEFKVEYDLLSNKVSKGSQSGQVMYDLSYSSGYQLDITIG